MKCQIQEYVSLAPLTTLGVGGTARFFVEALSETDIKDAIAYARECGLPLRPLGRGSNVLVPDTGVADVVLKMSMRDITFENLGEDVLLIAGAGALWENVIDSVAERHLFGIENLAGIPGTVGGASVQNIGAYGTEIKDAFEYADVINSATGLSRRISRAEAMFGYRTSHFKEHREDIIIRVGLRLTKSAVPNIAYADLVRAQADGVVLTTPQQIVSAVRTIRASKFPQNIFEGTAGSFFKNPVIAREIAEILAKRFPDMPMFPNKNGTVKISLAWLLDHGLSLKGFSMGRARLYENHSLVIVASEGALAAEIDALAHEVVERVRIATGIIIEREVETFGG